ncbi:MAG: DEAD/DEAH box helicase [Cytophagales bacterium]|jgi:ATP-dependent RNA helicase RhlE|nr:DEAD/DEAH box helicase [Cytophagales bacterium]MCA6387509.1 DEAD/DEAH box helicase [Cytophagales bacterium]MCA6391180.1 DEAD/DEAH box helicase [Cytophagales bacterium]MCA6395818.1 DEAD/DEAH box helicase [Cytophagales bacterium]MCA6397675.1 DEAD/DEAH box helicase [Cytophagales bacterium]
MNWLDFKLNKQLLDAVVDAGFTNPTEVQEKCIPLILGGQQVIGIAQTGTGKTAAYLLPVLMKAKFAQGTDPRVLILVPTKELVVQVAAQVAALSKYTDLRTVHLYGGVGPKTQIDNIKAGVDIIVATPGRFLELYQRNELAPKQIKTLVLDEADRMLDMGFMPQLRKIFEVIPSKRQNLLFSATFPQRVERLSQEFLEFPVRVEITPPATVPTKVEQELYWVPNSRTKINFLEYVLQDKEAFNRVMVFARTKDAANDIFKFIERKGYGPAKVVHSNKGQNSRINAVTEFKEGKLRVLVSTDVASRGIDVTNVSHVINFDVPIVYEDYVHRIGRTGRAFQSGKAITLVTDSEKYHIDKIQKIIREKIPIKKLPDQLLIAETPREELQDMAREIDRQKRYEDPEFKGAFHEKKRNL